MANKHVKRYRFITYELDAQSVRETDRAPAMTRPQHIARIARDVIGKETVECFIAFLLNTRNKCSAIHFAARGTLASCPVHPRDIFLPAVREQCASVVVAHNHPSGDCTPSGDDRAVTERLRNSGQLLGIEVLDHIIVGPTRSFYSFAEEMMLSFDDG